MGQGGAFNPNEDVTFGPNAKVTVEGSLVLKGATIGIVGTTVLEYPVDGALVVVSGVAVITKDASAAMTLAAPTEAQSGILITITSGTLGTHTVTTSPPAFWAGDKAKVYSRITLNAGPGSTASVIAYKQHWLVATLQSAALGL